MHEPFDQVSYATTRSRRRRTIWLVLIVLAAIALGWVLQQLVPAAWRQANLWILRQRLHNSPVAIEVAGAQWTHPSTELLRQYLERKFEIDPPENLLWIGGLELPDGSKRMVWIWIQRELKLFTGQVDDAHELVVDIMRNDDRITGRSGRVGHVVSGNHRAWLDPEDPSCVIIDLATSTGRRVFRVYLRADEDFSIEPVEAPATAPTS